MDASGIGFIPYDDSAALVPVGVVHFAPRAEHDDEGAAYIGCGDDAKAWLLCRRLCEATAEYVAQISHFP